MHTAVISAPPARESAAREAFRDRGVAGTHFQSARRFSGFYAGPRPPLEFGTFFRKQTLPARGKRHTFSFFEHLSSESAQNGPKRSEERKVSIIVAYFGPSQK